ncbi:MAG: riboflavin synthase [Betaproteobacteria bacterium]|nr:riboflavin synthase [Betaproteobacteria bacterium]
MFTGIVEAVGHVSRIVPAANGFRVTIEARALDLADVAVGDSIAVNGCCLTVVDLAKGSFAMDVSQETLDCTAGLQQGTEVNLEKALRLSDRLGGHLVTGHVDGVGTVAEFVAEGDSRRLTVAVPVSLARFIARKGSVTINGVSLTVNEASAATFGVNLIPHTLAVTNLKDLAPGARVNLEVDLIARYVEQLLSATGDAS